MASSTLILLMTFSLLISLTTAITTSAIAESSEILSDTGFTAMSLLLPLISTPLSLSSFPSVTLFAPSDDSFSLLTSSGQPPLSLLQFHFSPRFYSVSDLQYLPFGSLIQTLNPNSSSSLIITTSIFDANRVSINGVRVYFPPVFNDGFFVIFQIERFLNPNFRFGSFNDATSSSSVITPTSAIQLGCATSSHGGAYGGASAAMRSRGYSIMAAFLDLLLGFVAANNNDKITVFAPSDSAMEMEGHFGNNNSNSDSNEWLLGEEGVSLFLRHVVPCEFTWADLVALKNNDLDEDYDNNGGYNNNNNVLRTFLDGFVINVTHSWDTLMLNGEVPVDFPDLYGSDRIVVHGLSRVLAMPRKSENEREKVRDADAYSPASYHGEF